MLGSFLKDWKGDFGDQGFGCCFRDNRSRQAVTVTEIFVGWFGYYVVIFLPPAFSSRYPDLAISSLR